MAKVISYEEVIIKKVKNGDTAAFEELFNQYYQKLKHFTFQFTKSEFIAEEIVQEVFINLWVKRDKIDLNLSFNGYIYRILEVIFMVFPIILFFTLHGKKL